MLKLIERRDQTQAYICSMDEAIGPKGNHQAYLENYDESLLDLVAEPTRFRVRNLNQGLVAQATDFVGQNSMAESFKRNGHAPLSFMRECARCVVADVDNPDPSWGKPVTARVQGYQILAREVVDRLPDVVCLELVNCAARMSQTEDLKKN